MNRNRVKVTVCGTDYYLFANDTEEYVQSVAREVERQMEELMRSSTRISLTAAAVLTAMTCCDEELKSSGAADELRAQMKQYIADSARARNEAEESRREIDALRAQVQDLNDRLTALSEKSAADTRAHLEELKQAHAQINELRAQSASAAPVAPERKVVAHDFEDQTRLELPDDSPVRGTEVTSGEFMSLFDTFASGSEADS